MDDRLLLWKLNGHTPVVCDSVIEWGTWFETADRTVAKYEDPDTGAVVSTIFLGIDHSFSFLGGPPVLFETMVFGGALDGEQARYCTWDQAIEGHAVMVARVKS